MTPSEWLENIRVESGVGEGGQTVACGPEMGAVCRQRMFGREGHL